MPNAVIIRLRWLLEDDFSSELFRDSFSILPLLGDRDDDEELLDIIGIWKDFGLSLNSGRACGGAISVDRVTSVLGRSAIPCRHD